MKKLCLPILIMLLVSACGPNVEHYKGMYEGYVKELSDGEKYFGRTDYNGGNVKAAEFISAEIQKLGLEVIKQGFTYPKNTMHGALSFSVDGKEYAFYKDYVVKEFSSAKNATMDIYYLPDEYLTSKKDQFYKHLNSGKFQNSFVAFDFALFSKNFGGAGIELYRDNLVQLDKVGGVIFLNDSRPVSFVARAGYTTPFPVVSVGPEFPKDAKTATINLETEFLNSYTATNLLTYVKGEDGDFDDYYLFMAHYDHLGCIGEGNIFSGANDNASGTSFLLTLMNYYKKHKPEKSIVFLFLDAEEANLLGAYHYADNPIIPLNEIEFAFNLDMVGDSAPYLVTEMSKEAFEDYIELQEINKRKNYFTEIKTQPLADNSDHYAFAVKGVPVMYFAIKGEVYPKYHTPEDTYENFRSDKFPNLFGLFTDFIEED